VTGSAAYHVITEGEMPYHTHALNDPGHSHQIELATLAELANGANPAYGLVSNTDSYSRQIGAAIGWKGRRSENSGSNIGINPTGGNQGHTHGITINNVSTVPPYVALAYIIKL
jgi:microcystin-dependent protein